MIGNIEFSEFIGFIEFIEFGGSILWLIKLMANLVEEIYLLPNPFAFQLSAFIFELLASHLLNLAPSQLLLFCSSHLLLPLHVLL